MHQLMWSSTVDAAIIRRSGRIPLDAVDLQHDALRGQGFHRTGFVAEYAQLIARGGSPALVSRSVEDAYDCLASYLEHISVV